MTLRVPTRTCVRSNSLVWSFGNNAKQKLVREKAKVSESEDMYLRFVILFFNSKVMSKIEVRKSVRCCATEAGSPSLLFKWGKCDESKYLPKAKIK